MKKSPQIVVVMGSQSDLKIMKDATILLDRFGVQVETIIVSAHRTPGLLEKSVRQWESSGVKALIAGAGGAAHLPGMLAAFSILPVIGVPVGSSAMNGLDALLSIAQMPKGVPVATVAVNNSSNAALLALQILATNSGHEGERLSRKIAAYKLAMSKNVEVDRKNLKKLGVQKFLRIKK